MQDTKSIHKKSQLFLYTNNELSERELKKTTPFIIASKKKKNKTLRNKFNQGGEKPVC